MTDEEYPKLPSYGIDIKRISEEIIGEVPRITEHLFVSRILPIFTNRQKENIDVGVWMEYAPSMSSPIDVVGSDGSILFRVPPPLRSIIKLHRETNRDDPSLFQIVDSAKRKIDVHPGLGENFLQAHLAHLDIIRDLDNDESIQQWKDILRRYNLLPQDRTMPSADVVNKPSISFSDEDDPL